MPFINKTPKKVKKKLKTKVPFFNSLMYKMNFVLGKHCFMTFRKNYNLHLNPYPK